MNRLLTHALLGMSGTLAYGLFLLVASLFIAVATGWSMGLIPAMLCIAGGNALGAWAIESGYAVRVAIVQAVAAGVALLPMVFTP